MRKILVLPILLAAVFAGFDVVGATARGGRSVANTLGNTEEKTVQNDNQGSADAKKTSDSSSAVSARAANRNRVKQTGVSSSAGTGVAARAAKKSAVRSAVPKTGTSSAKTTAVTTNAKPGTGVKARAAAKQKAVNMGTKVSSATENTVLPQECQDAYYGCMDSFCMMANASGGRCRCDDRSEELDTVLDQIMKLDAQSKMLAEEGVERLERGKDVDAIYAMAEDAAGKVMSDQKKTEKEMAKAQNQKKSRQLDLSAFNSNSMFDTDGIGGDDIDVLGSDFSDKKGDALRSSATKLCINKVPDQCREFASMLQLVYAQKIKSDCIAYENDLKQQKMNSENLLKTAKKAVRDAAGEAYNRANRYKTVGECAVAYKQCMVGEDVCGGGFSKCVVNKALLSKSSSKTKKQIETGTTVIEIDAATFDAVSSRRSFCDRILDECENVRAGVWDEFLRIVAPELRAAEFSAEDDQRRNCAKNVVTCIKEVAKGEGLGLEEGSDNWFYFTSDPKNVEGSCGLQIEQCGAYDESSKKRIMDYVTLSLNAVRADRCTTSIKKCLESDDVCHKDYSNCVGTGMDLIWNSCTDKVAPDCAGKEGTKLQDYIKQVADGVLLNVDNEIRKHCRNAVSAAVSTLCSNETECTVSEDLINKHFKYQMCPNGSTTGCTETTNLQTLASTEWDKKWEINIKEVCDIQLDITQIKTTDAKIFSCGDDAEGKKLANDLNSKFRMLKNKVNSSTDVENCKLGKNLGDDEVRFENLTDNAEETIAQDLYNRVLEQIKTKSAELQEAAINDVADLNKYMAEGKENAMKEAKEVCDANPCACAGNSQYKAALSPADVAKYTTACTSSQKQACETDPCGCCVKTECSGDNCGCTGGTNLKDIFDEAAIKKYQDLCKARTKADKEEAAKAEKCDYGNCNACTTAKGKCMCVAKTYFQYGPMNNNNGKDNGEYAVMQTPKYNESNNTCSIVYNYVHAVGDHGAKGYDNGTSDDAINVNLTIKANTKISISSCEASTDKGNDSTKAYQDTLTIGDTDIDFKRCSKGSAGLVFYSGGNGGKMQSRGANACYWCSLDDLDEHPKSNRPTVNKNGSKNKSGKFLKFNPDTEDK